MLLSPSSSLDEVTLKQLVRAFYANAREDALIGPLFDRVHDWETHIARITAFWSSVALMSGTYHGQPMATHIPLDLNNAHFARWLTLFEKTAKDICNEQDAAYLIEKARRIAQSLELGCSVHRGELPSRADTSRRGDGG